MLYLSFKNLFQFSITFFSQNVFFKFWSSFRGANFYIIIIKKFTNLFLIKNRLQNLPEISVKNLFMILPM